MVTLQDSITYGGPIIRKLFEYAFPDGSATDEQLESLGRNWAKYLLSEGKCRNTRGGSVR